jgi:hypothetical protein
MLLDLLLEVTVVGSDGRVAFVDELLFRVRLFVEMRDFGGKVGDYVGGLVGSAAEGRRTAYHRE